MQQIEVATIKGEFNWARGLTIDLLQNCTERELSFQLCPEFGPLWKQFRHIGRVHENYLHALQSGKVEFGFQNCTYSGGASGEALLGYFDQLTYRHKLALEKVPSSLTIDWFGDATTLPIHVCRLIAHETLHHGQLILCWRALNKSFPKSWSSWGE
jgi:uncharacterized damage-inducible protein DinB